MASYKNLSQDQSQDETNDMDYLTQEAQEPYSLFDLENSQDQEEEEEEEEEEQDQIVSVRKLKKKPVISSDDDDDLDEQLNVFAQPKNKRIKKSQPVENEDAVVVVADPAKQKKKLQLQRHRQQQQQQQQQESDHEDEDQDVMVISDTASSSVRPKSTKPRQTDDVLVISDSESPKKQQKQQQSPSQRRPTVRNINKAKKRPAAPRSPNMALLESPPPNVDLYIPDTPDYKIPPRQLPSAAAGSARQAASGSGRQAASGSARPRPSTPRSAPQAARPTAPVGPPRQPRRLFNVNEEEANAAAPQAGPSRRNNGREEVSGN